jgi:hypothetical protein
MPESYVYFTKRLQKLGYHFTAKSDNGGVKVRINIKDTYKLSPQLQGLNEEMWELFKCSMSYEDVGIFSIYCPNF